MWFVLLLIVVGVIIYLLSQKKKPEHPLPPKNISSAFDFESPRLIQIIQESMEIINKTKNPQTAMRRYDDIKRNTERLFEILPLGRSINYEINGRKISGHQDMYIINEEKEKWLAENIKGGIGPPELIAITRMEDAEKIRKKDLPILGVPEATKDEVRGILAENAAKGANPKDVYVKVAKALTPFDWPEFDKWVKIFREAGEWPPLWDDVAEYYYAKDAATMEELVSWLNKDTLLKLAGQYELKLQNKAKKQECIDEILKVITDDYRQNVFNLLYPEGDNSLHKTKSALLAHTASMGHNVKELQQQYNEPGERIEISPAPDCCSWCAKHEGKIYRVATIKQENLPPFHPGCRCCFKPVAD